MKVIIKNPLESPCIAEIKGGLEEYQNIVGGYIEAVSMTDEILLVCNEEGKLQELPYNFTLGSDNIVGSVFFVGVGGENFRSLTEQEILEIIGWFE